MITGPGSGGFDPGQFLPAVKFFADGGMGPETAGHPKGGPPEGRVFAGRVPAMCRDARMAFLPVSTPIAPDNRPGGIMAALARSAQMAYPEFYENCTLSQVGRCPGEELHKGDERAEFTGGRACTLSQKKL